jgi:hypothetical protein
MLILQRTFLTRSGDPIVHAELHCRPDRYAQLVEFIRDEEPAVSTRPAPALNGKAKAATTKRQRGR